MIERIEELNGLRISAIEIRTDDDARPEPGEWHMAYEIIVKTELGFVSIRGCHDIGPQATVYRNSINPLDR